MAARNPTPREAELRQRVGAAIRSLRQQQRLSQTQLGERMGTAQPAVSDWERGIDTPLKLDRLLALDDALDAVAGEVLRRAGIHGPDSFEQLLERDPRLDSTARAMLLASYRAATHTDDS